MQQKKCFHQGRVVPDFPVDCHILENARVALVGRASEVLGKC